VLKSLLTSLKGSSLPIAGIASLHDFYDDLNLVLGAISDGPTKSFAFRRLKYLASKWDMYSVLHEYQELAEMKVWASSISSVLLKTNPIRMSLIETFITFVKLTHIFTSKLVGVGFRVGAKFFAQFVLHEPKTPTSIH
jgi:hypothetical protein